LSSARTGTAAALILGIPVDDVTMDETVDRIFDLVGDGRRTGRCHQVATVNVDFVVNALGDEELASIMRNTSLSIPDGMAIVWGARMLGMSFRSRVAGADLVPAIAARAALDGMRVALFGAGPGVAERAAATLRERYPRADVIGVPGPMFGRLDDLCPDDLAPLRDGAPDICCVAFGNPKQERFIARFGHELGIPVMIGIGGTLDFLVGEQRRAPVWMQRSGLEWLHRALSHPRRLGRRYARDAKVFVPRLGRQVVSGRPRRGGGGVVIVDRTAPSRLLLDVSGVGIADNRTAGTITKIIRAARLSGNSVEVCGASPAFARVHGLSELTMPPKLVDPSQLAESTAVFGGIAGDLPGDVRPFTPTIDSGCVV
jgi:exopolysaccharide biosynthesis WecB/TagA/CpsF family protein